MSDSRSNGVGDVKHLPLGVCSQCKKIVPWYELSTGFYYGEYVGEFCPKCVTMNPLFHWRKEEQSDVNT